MKEDWTEKYRPRSLSQIEGNSSALQQMKRWGESWRTGRPRSKCLILRGEPGIGKTSAALALANDMGWDCIEMNASDHRNAPSIKKVAGIGSVSQTFTLDGEFMSSSQGKRKLIILDEADNLFGREDYGGAKAIVDVVRESAQPIVLIVNDYSELTRKAPGIKSLADRVVFKRLQPASITSVLKTIASKEGIAVSEALLARISENSGGDMRAAINDLQMIVEGKKTVDTQDSDAMGKRNQEKELDIALRTMFGATTLRGARDATLDLDKMPDDLEKWIEENIPFEFRDSEDMARAFEALSRSDTYLGRTRALQHYGLWAYAKEMMTGGVALSRKHGVRPVVHEYRFPGYFILLSRAKGPRATRDAIAWKLAEHLHTSKRCVRESTLPMLSLMVRNDDEFLLKLVDEMGFDESDVAYLLDVAPDSETVRGVMARSTVTEARTARSAKTKPKADRSKKSQIAF